ncbi:MAG TPA: family 43 glycosylhydrolase [Opitutaceae bacterium]|nr:family 43 glycosylhydrolase [Opitutaceae bacterium]
MMLRYLRPVVAGLAGWLLVGRAFATNPVITDQFTADPTARVFDGRIYLYPSHDIPAPPGKARPDWFCMGDYHVFSSANLTDWTDHGVIVSQTTVPWVDASKYSMWAPDCVARNGKYYFFFPAIAQSGGFRIGVAIADHPAGPFQPETRPIDGVADIDPCVFIDRDGRAYLYYAMHSRLFVAKLKPSLLELDGPPAQIGGLPAPGLIEGPFVFERKGIYYLTYPHAAHRTERLEYSTGPGPLGPFRTAGVILDESPDGCWTVHQSIVEYQGQWYLFYHDDDLSPQFDKHRSVRADRLHFNADGTIQKVIPTRRGVGIVEATSRIQIDRYSAAGPGVSDAFLDAQNPFDGWKLTLAGAGAWARFNAVDFGGGQLRTLEVRAVSGTGATIELHLDGADGPVLARVAVPPGGGWSVVTAPLEHRPTGVHDLVVTQSGNTHLDVDWIRCE